MIPLVMLPKPSSGPAVRSDIRKLKEVLIHGIGAAAEYLSQLLRAEKLLLLDKPRACGEIPLGGVAVLHEVVSVYHTRAVIVPIPCDELNAVFAWSTYQHRAAEVSEDAVVAIQPAGFELRGGFHSGHILQRLRGDVLDAIQGILCLGRVRVLPTIEHTALAGDAAEGCAVPKDRQLISLQRQGFKACTVQGNTDFFKVAKLTACVLGVHVSDPPVVKK